MLPKLFGNFGYFFLFFAIFIPLFFKRLFGYKNNSRTNFLSCPTAPKMIQYVLPEYSISSEMYKRRLGTPMPGRFLFYSISSISTEYPRTSPTVVHFPFSVTVSPFAIDATLERCSSFLIWHCTPIIAYSSSG